MEKTLKQQIIGEFITELPEGFAIASDLKDSRAWIKFIFTDNLPNGNRQGIKKEEFDTVIKAGIYQPFKKAIGSINDGHEDAIPIGTIASMKILEDEQSSKVIGIAALWEKEYPEDIAELRKMKQEGKPLNISWELYYRKSEIDDAGVEWYGDIAAASATLVGMPAYEGRTPILTMASKEKTLMDLEEMKKKLDEALEQIKGLQTSKSSLEEEFAKLKTENEALAAYKLEKEKAEAEANMLKERITVLTEAGMNVTDEDFDTKLWTSLSDEQFKSTVGLLKSMASTDTPAENKNLPNLRHSGGDNKDDAQVLREYFKAVKE
jgi:regulator of replication initiation timing